MSEDHRVQPGMGDSRRRVALGYLRLPHAAPLLVVVGLTVALAIVVAGGWPPAWRLALMTLAMLGGQVVVGVANEIVDLDNDRATKPDKPIPAGLVSLRGAGIAMAAGAALTVAAGAPLGGAAFLLVVVGNGIGVAYSIWFKRTMFAWVPYLAALPLLPIWAAVALDRFRPALLALYPLGALAVVGVYLAHSAPDIAADRRAGLRTLTTRLGERGTLAAAWSTSIFSAALIVLLDRVVGGGGAGILWAAGLTVAMTAGNAALHVVRPAAAVSTLFPVTAVGAGMLGLAWVAAHVG